MTRTSSSRMNLRFPQMNKAAMADKKMRCCSAPHFCPERQAFFFIRKTGLSLCPEDRPYARAQSSLMPSPLQMPSILTPFLQSGQSSWGIET